MRIVSVCPSNTEILWALGLGEQLVGIDDCSDWPPEVQGKPRVGLDLHIDADKVAALRPDLVVASLSVPGMEQVVRRLEERKLPTLVLKGKLLPEVDGDIRAVAKATGTERRAEILIRDMHARIAAVRERNAGLPRLRVFLEWWPRPLITPTRDSWFNGMCAAVNAENVFAARPGESAPIEEQEVFAQDPDHVLLCWCGTLQRKQDPARVYARPGWDKLRAVQARKVTGLDEGLFGRPGPRLVEGVEVLEKALRG
ncbi:MAG: cobalamin-binding protein [Halobacteriales archaeon]|nr:cobalamin-binding protein [Halobacteriales archaeon]